MVVHCFLHCCKIAIKSYSLSCFTFSYYLPLYGHIQTWLSHLSVWRARATGSHLHSWIDTSKMAAALLMIASLQRALKKTIRTNLCHHFSISQERRLVFCWKHVGPFDMEQPGTIPQTQIEDMRARTLSRTVTWCKWALYLQLELCYQCEL